MKRDIVNQQIFGVCAGIAKYLNTDVTLVRVAFVAATLMGIGTPILLYIVLALIMKKE